MPQRQKHLDRQFFLVGERPPPSYLHTGRDGCSFLEVSSPLGDPDINLIQNPSFELSTDGWTSIQSVGTTFESVTEGYSGAFALQVTADVGSTLYDIAFTSFLGDVGFVNPFGAIFVGADNMVYGSVWVRGCRGDNITMQLIRDGVGVIIPGETTTNPSVTIKANGQWQRITTTWLANVDRNVAMLITNDNESGCGEMLVDAAKISLNDTVYFDGDSIGGSWDGAPHESTSRVDQFSSLTSPVNLTDLGLDIINYEGFGVPPVDNLSTSFARQHGSHFQRQRFLPRTLTIQADVQACDKWSDTFRKRCDLVNTLFAYKFRETCRFDLILYWTLRDDCCNPLTTRLAIPVIYSEGLSGLTNHLWSERITFQLVAHEQLFWYEESPQSSENIPLTPGSTRPNVEGNQPSHPIIWVIADQNPITLTSITNDVGAVRFAIGSPTVGYTVPAGNVLRVDTNPLSFNMTETDINGTETTVTNQFNYEFSSPLGSFLLVPGENNLRIDADSTIPTDARIFVQWRNQYLDAACAPLTGAGC